MEDNRDTNKMRKVDEDTDSDGVTDDVNEVEPEEDEMDNKDGTLEIDEGGSEGEDRSEDADKDPLAQENGNLEVDEDPSEDEDEDPLAEEGLLEMSIYESAWISFKYKKSNL
ncbi:histone acetyltransferase GCN5-like [Belonocnema kinseyi]|uniref:histone acetyltransferase GCN5-like n=1 Tax=Belonocnema kinseyi TaxID=2817044 RepID=UPI00143DE545|nr:histone acetyltransferase GCN5-like [Belonocnema kinseyi]